MQTSITRYSISSLKKLKLISIRKLEEKEEIINRFEDVTIHKDRGSNSLFRTQTSSTKDKEKKRKKLYEVENYIATRTKLGAQSSMKIMTASINVVHYVDLAFTIWFLLSLHYNKSFILSFLYKSYQCNYSYSALLWATFL